MSPPPSSLAAERAVRVLREGGGRASSLELAAAVLATRVGDEDTATRLLVAAFAGDARLAYVAGRWRLTASPVPADGGEPSAAPDADRTVVLLQGERAAARGPFVLRTLTAIRLRGDEVVSACGGDVTDGGGASLLREEVRATLEDSVPVLHDPPGSLRALERWLHETLVGPLSLRRLAQVRLGMPAWHDLGDLAARLGISWRDSDDPVDLAETMEDCLAGLRRPGESLETLREIARGGAAPVPWGRLGFDRRFLRELPETAGTYRFLDRDGTLLYVGKARNLRERVGSYFSESGPRTRRVQALLDEVHRIEIEPTGSDLEAALREAEQIARRNPSRNVQREIHVHRTRGGRLESILILEPAAPPHVLHAYLLRDGQLLARVPVGRRGGGLRRIERILDDRFFSFQAGPEAATPREVDVECIARWLAAHRDRVVAFDPTQLRSSREVIERLRWFLDRGGLVDPDGAPVVLR